VTRGRTSTLAGPARQGAVVAVVLIALVMAAGCGSKDSGVSEGTRQAALARKEYRSYLEENVATLTTWVKQLRSKLQRGLYTGAQSRYASARVPFGHIAPIAFGLPALASRINGAAERPGAPPGAFEEIQKALWQEEGGHYLVAPASRLVRDVALLQRKLKSADLRPAAAARDAIRTLAILSRSVATAPEYASTELVDAAARIEGVEAAFRTFRPLLAERDPDLVRKIESNFKAAYRYLGQYGQLAREPDQPRASSPGTSFVVYDELAEAEKRQLQSLIRELATLLSEASGSIADI
jgi:iron uptake system component EfeO